MIHVFEKGTSNRVIVTLHGHGGNATQLFDLARNLDPNASLLGLQGDIEELGQLRYFERYSDGSFNSKSLAKATQDVLKTLQDTIQKYSLNEHEIIILGYSNGANVLQSLLKTTTSMFKAMILFHPSVTRRDLPYLSQPFPVFVTHGHNDFYINGDAFEAMTQQMDHDGIDITVYTHDYGHQLTHDELNAAKQFINAVQ